MRKFISGLCLFWLVKLNLLAAMQTIAVLPFTNLSKNHNVGWISESFPELLQDRLRWPGLNVFGREERLIAFERIGIPYTHLLSKASLIKIGQELDSKLLILGDFDFVATKLKASASVLDLHTNRLSPPLSEEGELVDLQLICSHLAWQILRYLDSSFPLSREAFATRFATIPNIGLESYIRGLIESDRTKQIHFFRQADRAYPNFVKAIFQLGKIYFQEKDYSTSTLWLQRLLKLDKDFPQARFILGLNYLYLRNYEKAATEFQQLSQVTPLSEIHNNLGVALSFLGLSDKATASFQKAQDGDPLVSDYSFNLAYHFWKTGNFAGAAKCLKEILDRGEGDGETQYLLYKCMHAMGKDGEASAAWTVARQLNPRVENWEDQKKIPDLFRIQTAFDEPGLRQLQLEIQAVQESKKNASSP
jgi:tetratricopeptide (TPR) repeat protein